MQLRYFTAVTRLNLLQQLRNPASILILTIVPLVIIPFMEPAFKAMLLQDGYTNVTGSEQAVPSAQSQAFPNGHSPSRVSRRPIGLLTPYMR